MFKHALFTVLVLLLCIPWLHAGQDFEQDIIQTSAGDLKMIFIQHGTLMFEFKGMVIHIDPVGSYADYSTLPKADLVLITHHHGDHLDAEALNRICTEETDVILTKICREQFGKGTVMENGDETIIKGIPIRAVPAYNIKHLRSGGIPYHIKGEGNGYILDLGDRRVYIAGDTENIPEMKSLENIDIAFLPMNLPYTMTPEMVADAAKVFMPEILYPYHYGNTDPQKLVELLKDVKEIEVRIRDLR